MIIKDNAYLGHLIGECNELVNNIDDWIDTKDESMVITTLKNIKNDITSALLYN